MPKKKKYMVMARDKKTALTGLTTQRGGHRSFGNKTSAMWISDKAEAEEIDHKYGLKGKGDVFVVEDEKYSYAANGEQWDMKFDERGGHLKTIHHYTFAGVDTSHLRKDLEGSTKTVNGTTYRYKTVEGKLKLIPINTRPQKNGGRNDKEI